jgi:hypothetical protein
VDEPVRDRAARDATAHVSTVELRNAGRKEFRADNRLLIPQSLSVNRKNRHAPIFQPSNTKGRARRPSAPPISGGPPEPTAKISLFSRLRR